MRKRARMEIWEEIDNLHYCVGFLSLPYWPSSSSPKPKMCPTSMEPQEPAEPRHRAFSCHSSPLSDVDNVDFWRMRRLLRQIKNTQSNECSNSPTLSVSLPHILFRTIHDMHISYIHNYKWEIQKLLICRNIRHITVEICKQGKLLLHVTRFIDPSFFSTPCLTWCYLRP